MQRGRPTKCTPAVVEKIVAALTDGLHADAAATLGGIEEKTYYNWLKQGEAGKQPYLGFLQAVKEASAAAERIALQTVRMGGMGWQSSAWFLERRFPLKWSRRDPDHELKTKTMKVELDTLKARLKLLEAGENPDAAKINVIIPDSLRRDGE